MERVVIPRISRYAYVCAIADAYSEVLKWHMRSHGYNLRAGVITIIFSAYSTTFSLSAYITITILLLEL